MILSCQYLSQLFLVIPKHNGLSGGKVCVTALKHHRVDNDAMEGHESRPTQPSECVLLTGSSGSANHLDHSFFQVHNGFEVMSRKVLFTFYITSTCFLCYWIRYDC